MKSNVTRILAGAATSPPSRLQRPAVPLPRQNRRPRRPQHWRHNKAVAPTKTVTPIKSEKVVRIDPDRRHASLVGWATSMSIAPGAGLLLR
jgi:hypothetical protein